MNENQTNIKFKTVIDLIDLIVLLLLTYIYVCVLKIITTTKHDVMTLFTSIVYDAIFF